MITFFSYLTTFLMILGIACLYALLISVPIWLLWNWVGVDVLHLSSITLLQALGLALLSQCLFGCRSTAKSS